MFTLAGWEKKKKRDSMMPSRALLCAFLASAALSQPANFIAIPFPPPPFPALTASRFSGLYPPTRRPYSATLATFADASRFALALNANGCKDHAPVSSTASAGGCVYATNAGFFDFPPHAACEGNLYINSSMLQYTSEVYANFGTTANASFIGFLTAAAAAALSPRHLVSGRGWLLREGRDNVNASGDLDPSSAFVKEKAPRTGVGIAQNGGLMLLTVDGIEGSSGADLHEFAALLAELGAWHAVNLDGGGSTTSWYDGKVFNQPHCSDTHVVCERAVTTAACVRS